MLLFLQPNGTLESSENSMHEVVFSFIDSMFLWWTKCCQQWGTHRCKMFVVAFKQGASVCIMSVPSFDTCFYHWHFMIFTHVVNDLWLVIFFSIIFGLKTSNYIGGKFANQSSTQNFQVKDCKLDNLEMVYPSTSLIHQNTRVQTHGVSAGIFTLGLV